VTGRLLGGLLAVWVAVALAAWFVALAGAVEGLL
jgi:hypothetical protein